MSWVIRKITCQDIKGFNGSYEFSFESGLNVIYGPNGQGKSSIVDSLRWALIGKLPKVDAIAAGSQSLINKNAGLVNGMPEVIVEMTNNDNENMIIIRRGHKKPISSREYGGLTPGQEGLEPLEVSVHGDSYTGWYGEAQEIIEEKLGLKSSTLAKCSVVAQEDIMSIVSGKETELNNILHDLLGIRSLVDIGPELSEGKRKADSVVKKLNKELSGNDSPINKWTSQNDLLDAELNAKQSQAQSEHNFKLHEVEERSQIEDAIIQRFVECETLLADDYSTLEISDRFIENQKKVDQLSGQDPTHENAKQLVAESEKNKSLLTELNRIDEFWRDCNIIMSELLDEEELNLVSLASKKNEKEESFHNKKAEQKALDLSERLSTSIIEHLDSSSEDLDECPICKSPAEHAKMKSLAEELMSPETVAIRSKLKSEVEVLEEAHNDSKALYESAEELHTKIHSGVNEIDLIIAKLPNNVNLATKSEKQLLSSSNEISDFLIEIKRVKDIVLQRNKEIKEQEGDLDTQSEKWRKSTIEPLRQYLVEISALIQLLDAFSTVDNHATRLQQAQDDQALLSDRLDRAKALKTMLSELLKNLHISQRNNAIQAINNALPEINVIYREVCSNPQYDHLQIDPTIKKGSIVYSFRTLPQQRTFGDVAAVVLSGGNQAVASIAALMALAAGGSHQFPSLILDDPCVQMDPETIERWAKAASNFTQNQQLIVFTHQPEVADHLENNGAFRDDLNGWNQGTLPGRGQ